MIEIRIHGRGGQGIVTSGELIGFAAFSDGKYSQAMPAFGSERTGSPVVTYVRINDKPIRVRTPIYNPDYIIVQDATLLDTVPVLDGLKPGGLVIVNTKKTPGELGLNVNSQVKTVPATDLAIETLGMPIVNTTILGVFAAASGQISIEGIRKAIEHRFPSELAKKNLAAAQKGFDFIKERM
ncbi:MAG: pyruvate ferredoxin oxidoreductase [Planctomycetes bacterium RIFCSPHIGHO2_02_FULL_50_42]|uniref:pyruvate ferredoxin oxidoreductase subunit gamma n=1 Tax=Candidatus Avalokitesvara rifleensis TaxID=3367620 RepID=UPI0008CC7ACD|nr:pyruvate ferredoxin oxidoreductase subunit gamma [Candidatus Brocadiales bacterium]OHB88638.1 MAG: pyruvate ferredoxin oxidoreductase [Planctomycetes bacterium RIFCSPHIGHO2_02_FULL_50_42]OHB92151.1 MAG: pyruvate ferredoxin oxidoreductase [Planctomycetes bacterium RIFCSPHIGHO2_12_FULL_51_37]OHB95347.1 MAG: pyruvate ferredoxin oxidoreductase [Planctomycetes bacterium RIFCSPLOWO2_02_FULL_50_16]OHC04878.1 MAG: pyruvate ferredoxin oxidoreductase [Planctomycetes bacterium RIFCSPLOWO2_12_FULL_50_35